MKDRIPTYPGRVRLTPVAGQADTYDMTMADAPVEAGTAPVKANLLKDATAALYGLGAEAVPDDILAVLSRAALLKQVGHQPIYQEVTVDISALAVGNTARIPVNGAIVEYWVAAKDYEAALNGPGRTLLVAKDGIISTTYGLSKVTYYPGSNADTQAEDTYKPQIRADVREAIGLTSIKVKTYSSTEITTIQRGVFILSATEYGTQSKGDGSALPSASSWRPKRECWTRTPNADTNVFYVSQSSSSYSSVTNSKYIAPAFTLPNDFTYTLYTDGKGNYFTEQAYTPDQHVLVDVLGNDTDTLKIETGSYVGTGANSVTIPFYKKPTLIVISGSYSTAILMHDTSPASSISSYGSGGVSNLRVSWHETSVTWEASGNYYNMNYPGYKYEYAMVIT